MRSAVLHEMTEPLFTRVELPRDVKGRDLIRTMLEDGFRATMPEWSNDFISEESRRGGVGAALAREGGARWGGSMKIKLKAKYLQLLQ